MDWQWLYVGVRRKQRDRLISGEVYGLRMPLYPILCGWVFIAWPWCHLGSTCRACPFRSLLSGHHLSGATPQTLLWGLQESSRICNPSAKAKGRCGVQFQLHIGITMELLKKITTLVLGFLCHAGCYWNNWQKSQPGCTWNSTLVSILNFSNCSVVIMDGNSLYLGNMHE